MRPDRAEYERAVALALAAIRATQAQRDRPKADRRRPDALADAATAKVAELHAKALRGETVTPTELSDALARVGEMAAAVAEREAPRGVGRPKGSRDRAALAAFRAAAVAVSGTGLRDYRNDATGHRLTRCDAIAEAMNAAGMRSRVTYTAVARTMRDRRKRGRVAEGTIGPILRDLQRLADLSGTLRDAIDRCGEPAAQALDRFKAPTHRLVHAWSSYRASLPTVNLPHIEIPWITKR